MTATVAAPPPAPSAPVPPPTPPSSATPSPAPPPRKRELGPRHPLFVPSTMLNIIAVLTLTFAATMAVVGPVRHARDQQTAFATLRSNLANATAPVTQLDGDGRLWPLGTPIAILDIPQIGLREVVFEGTTSGVLMSGPGHRRDSVMPGQAGTSVIMGRQTAYGGPFGSIHQLQNGNVFTVTTGQGKQVFRVVAIRKAGELAPPALAQGKGRITLITAAGRNWVPEGLLRVDADLVSATQPSGARPLTAAALPQAEKSLSGDTGVWVSIMLLTQGLLLATVGLTLARYRWGEWQTWLAGGPFLAAFGVALANQVACLLPNLT